MIRYPFIGIVLAGMLMGSASAKEQETVDLTAYQWKNRLLIVFSPAENDLVYQSFDEQLQRRAQEIGDRDLLIFHVFESGEGRVTHLPLNKGQVLFLRREFSILSGQRVVILIGKDGEVKLRRALPVDLSEIFSVIDAMPMRQRERRERAK
jgi:hypothetical protein